MTASKIRVLIADDQHLIRAGLRSIFDDCSLIEIVAEAGDGAEAVRLTRALRPDVALVDLRMPRQDGLQAIREICGPGGIADTRVVVLTMFDIDDAVFSALRSGACGFVLKDAPTEHLVAAVRAASCGDALLSPRLTARLIREFARTPSVRQTGTSRLDDLLTERERRVLDLVVAGQHNDEIARALYISESTVKSHVRHLCQKLGARDRVQLVIFAYENGIRQVGTA